VKKNVIEPIVAWDFGTAAALGAHARSRTTDPFGIA